MCNFESRHRENFDAGLLWGKLAGFFGSSTASCRGWACHSVSFLPSGKYQFYHPTDDISFTLAKFEIAIIIQFHIYTNA